MSVCFLTEHVLKWKQCALLALTVFFFVLYSSWIEQKPHVLWFDNFSKTYVANKFVARNPTNMKLCLWSAEGLAFVPQEGQYEVPSLNFVQDDDGRHLRAMPKQDEWPFYFNKVKEALVMYVDKTTPLLFSKGNLQVVTQNIGSIPLTYKRSLTYFKKEAGEHEPKELATARYNAQFTTYRQLDGFHPRTLVQLKLITLVTTSTH
jgi:hypothetical protein